MICLNKQNKKTKKRKQRHFYTILCYAWVMCPFYDLFFFFFNIFESFTKRYGMHWTACLHAHSDRGRLFRPGVDTCPHWFQDTFGHFWQWWLTIVILETPFFFFFFFQVQTTVTMYGWLTVGFKLSKMFRLFLTC